MKLEVEIPDDFAAALASHQPDGDLGVTLCQAAVYGLMRRNWSADAENLTAYLRSCRDYAGLNPDQAVVTVLFNHACSRLMASDGDVAELPRPLLDRMRAHIAAAEDLRDDPKGHLPPPTH